MNNEMSDELTRHLREEEIVPYLEGKLPEARRAGLDGHLQGCGDCRAHMDELRSVMAEMGEWVVSEPPETLGAFDAAVRTRIAAEGDAGSGWLAGWMQPQPRPAWGLALGVLVLGAAGLWMLPRDTVTPDDGIAGLVIEADVDAVIRASGDDGVATGDELWMTDYELIQEFDALFEDGENGNSRL